MPEREKKGALKTTTGPHSFDLRKISRHGETGPQIL